MISIFQPEGSCVVSFLESCSLRHDWWWLSYLQRRAASTVWTVSSSLWDEGNLYQVRSISCQSASGAFWSLGLLARQPVSESSWDGPPRACFAPPLCEHSPGHAWKPPPLTVIPTALQLVPVQVRKICAFYIKWDPGSCFLRPFPPWGSLVGSLCLECALPSSPFFLGVEGRKVVLSLPCFTKDKEDSESWDWVHY